MNPPVAFCENCKRTFVPVSFYRRSDLKTRKKLCNIPAGHGSSNVRLCECCYAFLTTSQNRSRDYWPTMIFLFLSLQDVPAMVNLSFREKWKMIPVVWRQWWEVTFSEEIAALNDDDMESAFIDVTEQKVHLEEVIGELKWRTLGLAMDRHFAYPEVSW